MSIISDTLNNPTLVLIMGGGVVLFLLWKWYNSDKENGKPAVYRKMKGDFLID